MFIFGQGEASGQSQCQAYCHRNGVRHGCIGRPRRVYAVAEDEIAVHLYGESKARLKACKWCRFGAHTDNQLPLGQCDCLHHDTGITGEVRSFASHPGMGERCDAERQRRDTRPFGMRGRWLCPHRAGLEYGDTVALYLPLALRPQFANPKVRDPSHRSSTYLCVTDPFVLFLH